MGPDDQQEIGENYDTHKAAEGPKKVLDPKEYFNSFLGSDIYKEAFDIRLKKLAETNPNFKPENATHPKLIEGFLNSEEAKIALSLFNKQQMELVYDEDKYPPEVAQAIQEYVDNATKLKNLLHAPDLRSSSEAKQALYAAEVQRSEKHNLVAKRLVDAGIVPTEKMGRVIGRLILIDLGIDDYDQLFKSDKERVMAYMQTLKD